MQDRFKFRFWFKNTQEMIYSEKFNDVQTLGQWFFGDRKDVVKMQCTGLKDKNGKLIYEGDIVKFGQFYDNEWHSFNIGKVYWGGEFDYPAFELQCSTADFDMCNGLSYIFGNSLYVEAIGNIYENPELLEVENERN